MHSTNLIICTLIASSLTAACSVKEDRSACPCHLTVDFNDANIKMPGGMVYLDFKKGTGEAIQGLMLPAIERKYPISLTKGLIHLFASTEGGNWNIGKDRQTLLLNAGNQADSIYAYARMVECFDETAEEVVHLHKQWCTLLLVTEKPEAWKSSLFELSGEWSGMSMADLYPVKGEFLCTAEKLSADRLAARIPRQGDDSLILKIFQRGEKGSKGKLLQSFPLGEMISATGYDWDAEDLKDLVLKIARTETGISIEIADWINGENDSDIKI